MKLNPQIAEDGSEIEELKQRLKHITEHLEAAYGVPQNTHQTDPLDELIATILSQSTSDVNSHRAFQSLKQKYQQWESVQRARLSSIALAIKSGGLANVKSVVIKNVLNEIKLRLGSFDLSFLRKVAVSEAMRFLTSLKGVGPKTARCVLLFACERPVFPMDTHIFRILRRLEVLPMRGNDELLHTRIEPLIPPGKHYSLHINLIRHGRRVCHSREPECLHCCLIEYCPTGQGLIDFD
ncbi:MAG TPA: endonuclease III [Blastocatellia bacterium]|nr:endonuclease III [Blastocatellia bacterium]